MSLETETPKEGKGPTKLIVPLVISIGIFLGVVLSYLLPLPPELLPHGPLPPGPFAYFAERIRNAIILDMVLSTVSVSLLVSLVVVYLRIYAKTGARFALGILVVMVALLLQSLFRSPMILDFVGRIPISVGGYLVFADIFSIAAYSIFLYLSLE